MEMKEEEIKEWTEEDSKALKMEKTKMKQRRLSVKTPCLT